MKLIDKDLMSMQEVRELVESAKEAQRELARMDQAAGRSDRQVNRRCRCAQRKAPCTDGSVRTPDSV